MTLAPIVLFTYNRPRHTKQTVDALKKNELAEKSDLFIFSDGPKNDLYQEQVKEVRKYIKTISGFKSVKIIEREKNLGLANSVIKGVTQVINQYGKVIVLEDDLITSTNFLMFMNKALNFYSDYRNVFAISGFVYKGIQLPEIYDTFWYDISPSTGWATWDNMWKNVKWNNRFYNDLLNSSKTRRKIMRVRRDLIPMLEHQLDNKIDSWAIKWNCYLIANNGYGILPAKSKVMHIGDDELGTHVKGSSTLHRPNLDDSNKQFFNFAPKRQNYKKIRGQMNRLFHTKKKKTLLSEWKKKFVSPFISYIKKL